MVARPLAHTPERTTGRIKGCRVYDHRVSSRGRQGKASDEDWVRPNAEHLVMRLDCGESCVLPSGPRAAHSWRFATARRSVTHLDIVCWGLAPGADCLGMALDGSAQPVVKEVVDVVEAGS